MLLLCTFYVQSQTVLYNGNGFFENRTTYTDYELSLIPGRVLIGIPGGPISKLAQPSTYPNGWGLNTSFTTDVFSLYPDEDGSSLTKWIDKENLQPDYSYLTACNDLTALYPEDFGFVFRININSSPQEALNSIGTLIAHNSYVHGVVAGSEVYSWLNFDFDQYIALAEPILIAIHAEYPSLKLALCSAPNPDRNDHNEWNQSVKDYATTNPYINAIDVHLYVGEKNCPDTWNSMPLPRVITAGALDSELATYFDEAYDCLTTTTSLKDRLCHFNTLYPNMEIWCMEGFTTNPSAYFGNTFLNALFQFKSLTEIDTLITIAGKQSGVTPDLYGDFSRSNQYDIMPAMLKRTGYFATLLSAEANTAQATAYTDNAAMPLENKAAFTFYNKEVTVYTVTVAPDYIIDSICVRMLSADQLYSSSGSTQYMAKGTAKSYEIADVTSSTIIGNSIEIPQYAFGYFTVYQHEKQEPPKTCYKKRLIFKFLGCKADPNCSYNNCSL